MKRLLVLAFFAFSFSIAHAQTATVAPSPTPELSMMVTVIPPGGELSDAQDAVIVYELNTGDLMNSVLLFAVVVLFLLNVTWELRRKSKTGAQP